MSRALDLTRDLIARASLTPSDEGCQQVLAQYLRGAGFSTESLRFGEVDNLWARRGVEGPVLCFAGHTDVVPTGPVEGWSVGPFEPCVREGVLYGRGAADMKSGLAAMVVAAEEFVAACPRHKGSIAFLITSDEEGPSVDGTRRVVETLIARGEHIDWCVLGEPSSEAAVGDTIKVGRRGSLSARLTVHGVQGHIAYPHLAENPIHTLAPALAELTARTWDQGTEQFPATSFQVSNLNAGTGAGNVIPGELKARFNLRYAPVQTHERLKETVEAILRRHRLRYTIAWSQPGEPFYTAPGRLSEAVASAVQQVTGSAPRLSTAGGTSDGRFIAPMGAQVVELGVVNASIHKVDECVRVADIELLRQMYLTLMLDLLG